MTFRRLIFNALLSLFLAIPAGYAQLGNSSVKSSIGNFAQSLQNHNVPFSNEASSFTLNDNYLNIMALSGAVYLIMNNFDSSIDEEYALENEGFPMRLLKSYGEVGNLYDRKESHLAIIGLSTAAIGYGLLADKQKPMNTVKLMFKSWIASVFITSVMKTTFSRHRPYVNQGSNKFNLFNFSTTTSKLSFPSGHTSSIFALMTVLANQYDRQWVKFTAYGFATSVAFQRMLYRKHWASDVIVGGLIGYLTGNCIVKKHRERIQRYSLSPYSEGNKFGLVLKF